MKLKWFEELPKECPPNDAKCANGDRYYRLVSNLDNALNELVSQRIEHPNKQFNQDECICHAVSIFLQKEDCERMKKFPRHKKKVLFDFILKNGDGLIKKTFRDSHYSWWRSANFAIKNNEKNI